MNRIRLLPEVVANQIAAGEVIERPASVLKELVENSLDAGATQIEVQVGAGGRSLLEVCDNGSGMSKDDALLCLERHATSKLRESADLARIGSYGFRGEAIPSIASVSRFRLRTREPDAVAGTEIIIDGGKLLDVRDAGLAPGTQIEVRSLFYNLPARRKFLRTEATENAHLRHQMILFGLARPDASFQVREEEGGAIATFWPGGQTLLERIGAIYGATWADALVPIEAEQGDLRLTGFIGRPGISRASRQEEHVYVNKRPVVNRTIQYGLMEGYHNALMRGRYPVSVLFLEMDPSAVDVNVHPAKREVRFHDDMRLRQFIVRSITAALREASVGPLSVSWDSGAKASREAARAEIAGGTIPSPYDTLSREQKPAGPVEREASPFVEPPIADATVGSPLASPEDANIRAEWLPDPNAKPPYSPSDPEALESSAGPAATLTPEPPVSPDSAHRAPGQVQVEGSRLLLAQPAPIPASDQAEALRKANANRGFASMLEAAAAQQPLAMDVPPSPRRPAVPSPSANRLSIRLMGVIADTYLIGESPEGMVLIDQHAAHERVLFEQMLRRLDQEDALAQRLLLPVTLSLPPRETEFLRDQIETLNRIGVGVSVFGPNTFFVDALPPMVKTRDVAEFVRTLVVELQESGGETRKRRRLSEETVAKTVCRHAVKAHDRLRPEEWEHLLHDLLACDLPFTCPHGRPTMIQLSVGELEKKFGRAV